MSEQQRSPSQLAPSSGIVKDDIYITDGAPLRTIAVSGMLPDTMARETWRVEDFDLHKELYRGKTSLLYMATDRKSGIQVALKLYRKRKLSTLNRYQVEREIRIHIQLYHHNIIKLYAAFEDEKNVYMVQEFAGGGDLFEDLKRNGGSIKEKYTVRDIVVPFLNALQYLHSMGIIHRDIKPENILLTKDRIIKIADFGLSICCTQERPVTRAGTLDYMAPEVLICPDKRRPEENKDKVLLAYTAQVDAWAVGILCYELMVGYPPFEQESRAATYEHIMYKEPKFPSWMSEEAKKFISAALCKNSTQRPTIGELGKQPLILAYAKPAERTPEAPAHLDFLVERSARSVVATSGASSTNSSPGKPVSTASSAACTATTAGHPMAPVGTKRPGMTDMSMDSSMDGYHSAPGAKQDGKQNDLKLSVSGKVSNSSSMTLDEDASYSITDFATDDNSYYGGSPGKAPALARIPSQPRLGASPLIKSRLGASQAGQSLSLSISPFQGMSMPQGKVSPVFATLGAAPKSLSQNGTGEHSVDHCLNSYYKPQNGILSDDANLPRSSSMSGAAGPTMQRQASGLGKNGMERPLFDKLLGTEPEYQEPAAEKERDSKGVSRLFAKMGWGSSKASDSKANDGNSSHSSPITGKITSAALALANRSSKGGRTLTEELLSDRSDSLLVTDRHGSVVGAPTMNFKKPNPAALQARAAASQQPEHSLQESKGASFRATGLMDELGPAARMHSEATLGRVAALANSGRSFTSPNSPTMKKLANAPIVNKIQEYVTQNAAGQNMSNA